MRQESMPDLGLGLRDELMGLGELLKVIDAGGQRILIGHRGADTEHVQDYLGVLRVVLIPAVVQRFTRPGECHTGDELNLKTSHDQTVGQNAVIVPRWFDPDDDGSRRRVQRRDKTIVIGSSVEDGHSASTSLARVDQNLVAVFYGTELISVAILCWSQEAAV